MQPNLELPALLPQGTNESESIGADVRVVLCDLDRTPVGDPIFDRLTADERRRAAAFAMPRLAHRAAAARAHLRAQLVRFGVAADAAIRSTPAGKPFIEGSRIVFSVSHSEHLALYAFALDHAVGVDVELAPRLDDVVGLAERFLALEEAAMVKALSLDHQRAAFLEIWTTKEAMLKAVGHGIAGGLDRFAVVCGEDGVRTILRSAVTDLIPTQVTARSLTAALGVPGACAVVGAPRAFTVEAHGNTVRLPTYLT